MGSVYTGAELGAVGARVGSGAAVVVIGIV